MILRRSKILAQIVPGKSNVWIARNYGHGRSLIREIPPALDADLSQIFVLHNDIGAPKKVTPEVTARTDELTSANRTMPSAAIAQIVTHEPGMPKLSASTVDSVRHQLGYKFLQPAPTFPLTPDQIAKQLEFVMANVATDWSKTVFTDESSFVLGVRGWVSRRRAETGLNVCWVKGKFPLKVIVFAGISKDYKSTLVIVESGTINAESSVDDFVDQSGIISDMNQRHGRHGWQCMQDDARAHIASSMWHT